MENLPDLRMLLEMARAMVGLSCAFFSQVPKRITLDIDDTFDAVHGCQQLRLFNARLKSCGAESACYDTPSSARNEEISP